MVKRLVVGCVLGLVIGGAVAAGLVAGLGVSTFASGGGAILAYLAAALTGVLIGLVAGKPIWASGAKVEAALKAVFGALVGTAAMFALRKWAGSWTVPNLPAIGANGQTPMGELPAVSLPLVAALLGAFFELDNTGDDEQRDRKDRGEAKGQQRVEVSRPERGQSGSGRTTGGEVVEDSQASEVASKHAKN